MKHYIRLDGDKIIKGFSSAFEQPQKDDVLIAENAGRHFELNGQVNPPLTQDEGIPLYKYSKGKVSSRTKAEIDADIALIPPPPKPEIEVLRDRIKELESALIRKDLIKQSDLTAEKELVKEVTK